jgi:haloacetate dehalogenase
MTTPVASAVLLPGFEYRRTEVNGVSISCAIRGSGPPLLLLHGYPEHMIAADPDYWVRALMGPLLAEGADIEPEVMEDYIRCFRDPGTIAGSCADYRSSAGIDLVHDDENFAGGQKVECPVLALWGERSHTARCYEPLSVWQQYAADVRGYSLPTGHFVPEEAPERVSAALRDFLD